MASYARCLCLLFLLSLSLSLQSQARESKFFSKFTHHIRRYTLENPDSSTLSPAQSPSIAPIAAPESSVVVEHGYGLYGREPAAQDLNKKTFRDFVMDYPNDNGDGWNANKKKQETSEYVEDEKTFRENEYQNENEKEENGEKRYLVNGKYYTGYLTKSPNGDGHEQTFSENAENDGKYYSGYITGEEKQGKSEYVEENEENFPENKGNGIGKYYNGYVTKSENAYLEDEDRKEKESEYEGEKRYLVNGKYYSGYVTKSRSGNGNEKQGENEYMEEYSFPENAENKNENENESEYETEMQGKDMGEKKYLVNGKYYSGYVTRSGNEKENVKQGENEYKEEYSFPENIENENEYETKTKMQGKEMGEKKYLVNGKYYSGYVTKSGNENENEKQGENEYKDEYGFPESTENKNENENESEYETEMWGKEMGEKKYLVNGKYYSGYVTKSGNGNENEKQGKNEYKEEYSFPENTENESEYETETEMHGKDMGEKKYLVNGKYYSGYVTKSGKENENEKQGENEYSFPEKLENENESEYETETELQRKEMGEKKYLVNGKYYDGYLTKSEDGYNKNEFYNENSREGEEGYNYYP